MSSSHAVALYQNTHPKLSYYLTTAIVAGMLAIPTGMLLTRLLATKMVPTAVVPAASQPAEILPNQSAAAESTTRDVAPSAATPMESAGRDAAPSADTTIATVPPEIALTATMSMPASTAAAPPEADRIPDLAVAPSAAGNVALSRRDAVRTNRAHATAHAAVVAMAKLLGTHKSGAPHARRAGKEGPARNGSGSRNIGSPQQPVGTATMEQVSTLDHRGGGPGVLGGPATTGASNATLNGTGMRHRF